MKITNYEFKVRVENLIDLEQSLLTLHPRFVGEDHQVDTYYDVPAGRLKLREGNIENALIYYDRKNIAGSRQSDIILYRHEPAKALGDILLRLHGIKVIIDKTRRIYFIENVKFHFDTVKDLGFFIEVEAIDETGDSDIEILKEQCNRYFSFFKLPVSGYVDGSYSDLLLEKRKNTAGYFINS